MLFDKCQFLYLSVHLTTCLCGVTKWYKNTLLLLFCIYRSTMLFIHTSCKIIQTLLSIIKLHPFLHAIQLLNKQEGIFINKVHV